MSMRKSLLVAAVVTMGAALWPTSASADATYHSTHIALLPTAGTTGGSGFVENIHPDGPNVYAHEQYVLRHAAPGTSYQVTLHIDVGDPTCRSASVDLPSAVLRTNTAGNAAGSKVFTPADAAGLPKGVPHGIVWTVSAGQGRSYASGCERVVLD